MTPTNLPKPWQVVENQESLMITDATGYPIAYIYFEDRPGTEILAKRLTKAQARAVAAAFVKVGR